MQCVIVIKMLNYHRSDYKVRIAWYNAAKNKHYLEAFKLE